MQNTKSLYQEYYITKQTDQATSNLHDHSSSIRSSMTLGCYLIRDIPFRGNSEAFTLHQASFCESEMH